MQGSLQVRRRRQSAQTAALILGAVTAAALLAAFVATIIASDNAGADSIVEFENRPPAYYAAHGLGLLGVLVAGVLAIVRGRLDLLRAGARIALAVLCAVAVVWAAVSYTVSELLSRTVFGATGPFVWLTLVFVLVGTDRRVWAVIDPLLHILAYVTSVLALLNLLQPGESAYVVGYTKSTAFSILLLWLGGWTLLSGIDLRGWPLVLRAVPVLLLFLTAIQSQARSWLLMAFLLAATFLLLRGLRQGSIVLGFRNVAVAGLLAVIAAFALSETVFKGGLEGIAQRLEEDTRSLQYLDFFLVVPVSDLLLGRGPTGTWYWYGIGEYQFFDNGFLWMLFIGGVPTLVSYIAFVLWPAVSALRMKPTGADAAAVWLVLFWGLALAGVSTYTLPSVAFGSYLISLYAGRCHLILAEKDYRKRLFIERRHLDDARRKYPVRNPQPEENLV